MHGMWKLATVGLKEIPLRSFVSLENSLSTICLWFPTLSESARTLHKSVSDRWSFPEPNPDDVRAAAGKSLGCALSERDAALGAVQLCQNKVTDEISTQWRKHGCQAHPKPQSTYPLSTPPPLMPHPTAPQRGVIYSTPRGSLLHDLPP